MKVVIFGASGMLGRYVSSYLIQDNIEVIQVCRKDFEINLETNKKNIGKFLDNLSLEKDDVVINCSGLIKPQVDKYGQALSIMVNSLFPHLLAEYCEDRNHKMIHITTDCVFSGNKGKYSEIDAHDISDIYGRTKSLGEPKNCTVIRTSIIGEEIEQGRSLLEWVKANKGGKVNGFNNHEWNGVTCLQLAKIILEILKNKNYWSGVRHVYSGPINKFQLLELINKIYNLNILITETVAETSCDRTLDSVFNPNFNNPSLENQIIELLEYSSTLKCHK
jgi:dTDP-4-dehydrorhamnose reductase